MPINDDAAAVGRYRIQVLYRPPRLFAHGEDPPQHGWSIMDETWVYKDGKLAGMFAGLTGSLEAGRWNLRYEWVGEGLSTKEALA
ncbi:MAG: hypothetical protein ACLP8S_10095 [Solirubrobacteraceae bacterium]